MPLHEDYEWPNWDENILGRPTSTIGLDEPGPGKGIFQIRFSVSLQVVTSPVSLLMPWAFGPRNPGQSAACRSIVLMSATSSKSTIGCLIMVMLFSESF